MFLGRAPICNMQESTRMYHFCEMCITMRFMLMKKVTRF